MHTILPNTYRDVHYHDIVPHIPLQNVSGINYNHIATEVWFENEQSNYYKICITDEHFLGEDPDCSDSVPDYDYSISDHFIYLGISTGCDAGEVNL